MPAAPEEEVVKAAPRASAAARRTSIAVGALLGLLLVALPDLLKYADRDLLAQHRYVEAIAHATFVLRGMALVLLLLSIWAFMLAIRGVRIVAARRVPLPGVPVDVDTRIVRGPRAVAIGLFLAVAMVVLGAMTLYMSSLVWQGADLSSSHAKRGR